MPTSKKLILGSIQKDIAAKMMKDKARELAGAIRDALPEGYEYMLVLREAGTTIFFSDAQRAEAIRALRAVLEELEGS